MESFGKKIRASKEPSPSGNVLRAVLFLALLFFGVVPPGVAQEIDDGEQETREQAEENLVRELMQEEGTEKVQSSQAGPYAFRQRLLLNPYRGLPSHLTVVLLEGRPRQVRLLLEADKRATILPLRPDENNFTAFFPTPKKSLFYRLQFTGEDNSTWITPLFNGDPRCSRLEAGEALQNADHFPRQQQLLREILALDHDLDVLKYLIYAMDQILEESR